MSNESSQEIIERDKSVLAEAVKRSIKEHLTILKKQSVNVYGYSLITADQLDDILTPCGVANSKSRSDTSELYEYFSPDEWSGDFGEWGNKIFNENTPIFLKLIDEFKAVHTSEAAEFCYDKYEMSFIGSIHEMFVKVLKELRSEGVFKPEDFLAVWVSDPNDWEMAFNSIRELNSTEVLDGWYGNNA